MDRIRRYLWALWRDRRAISSVEYALLLAFIGASIIAAADSLSNAVSNEMNDTAALFDGDSGDNNCGNDGGGGSGSGNTCE